MQRLEVSGAVRPLYVREMVCWFVLVKTALGSQRACVFSSYSRSCTYTKGTLTHTTICPSRVYYMEGNVRTAQHWGAFAQPPLPWKTNKYRIFWVYVCSLSYAEYKAHELFCYLWPVQLYHALPHFLTNGKIFGGKGVWGRGGGEVPEPKMCVLISHSTFVWNNSHSKKKRARCDKKCT